MEEFVRHYGWQLLKYPIEIAANALVIYFVLNRIVPPQYDIKIADETAHPKTEPITTKRMAYPLARCFALSALLFVVFLAAMFCLTLPRPEYIQGFLVVKFVLAGAVWYFGSKLVIDVIFRMPRGQIVIFILYIVVSVAVEWILGWAFPA